MDAEEAHRSVELLEGIGQTALKSPSPPMMMMTKPDALAATEIFGGVTAEPDVGAAS